MRYELTDHECAAIKSMLPNKPRGVPRVNDRRVLNGIFWVLRSYPATVLHCTANCSAPRSDNARIV
jgi:transposase